MYQIYQIYQIYYLSVNILLFTDISNSIFDILNNYKIYFLDFFSRSYT